jgi:restriction system protein
MEEVTTERTPHAWLIQPNRGAISVEPRRGDRTRLTVGRDVTGDLLQFATKTELFHRLVSFYSRRGSNPAMNHAVQFWNLAHEIRPDDYVVVVEGGDGSTIAIGTVDEGYRFDLVFSPYERHGLTVKWLSTGLDRSAVRSDLRANLGSLVSVRELTDNNAAARVADLAARGIDPGDGGPSERTELIGMLARAAESANDEPLELMVRELLKYWGFQQRSSDAVAEIKRDLLESGLTTSPPFTEVELDRKVRLVAIESGTTERPEVESGPAEAIGETEDVSEPRSVVMLVGHRTRPTEPIAISASLEEAWYRMTEKKYSQLAVVDGDGKYLGAVTSESFMNLHMAPAGSATLTLSDVLDDQIPTAYRQEHLLERLDLIFDYGFVFVYDDDRRTIDGILTAADLTKEFGEFIAPFMILEEIENRLRFAVDTAFTLDEIKAAARLKNEYVHSAANMMMGDYAKMLKKEPNWSRFGWRIPQALFLEKLAEVTKIRNTIMHFSPDPLSPEQVDAMIGLRNILRSVLPQL